MGDARRIVLLTGAAGRIGTAFRRQTGERYRFRLADRQTDGLGDTPGTGHQILALDIVDAEAVGAACVGVDSVVHLAADPSPEADWETPALAQQRDRHAQRLQGGACRRV
ncbi:MAG TPA: NAD-dependent epimerase/dehydratase family protein [Thermomicrobiales bacterium]|nr:NAD-dependent epimerase/dehydratase family protein [Thermomicrobiales bacterium]